MTGQGVRPGRRQCELIGESEGRCSRRGTSQHEQTSTQGKGASRRGDQRQAQPCTLTRACASRGARGCERPWWGTGRLDGGCSRAAGLGTGLEAFHPTLRRRMSGSSDGSVPGGSAGGGHLAQPLRLSEWFVLLEYTVGTNPRGPSSAPTAQAALSPAASRVWLFVQDAANALGWGHLICARSSSQEREK